MCHTLPVKSALVLFCLIIALLAPACSSDDAADNTDENAGENTGDNASDNDANVDEASPGDQPSNTSASGGLQIIVFGMRNGTALTLADQPDGAGISQLPSGANNVYFTGEAQTNAAGELLWKVEYNGQVGWVPPRFGYPAVREDVTAEVASAFGATNAAQDNAVDTALVVSGLFSLTSPPSGIMVSQILPTADRLGHVVIDVVDEGAIGQPGVLGFRIEVLSEADAAGRYQITQVWRTAMCQNGAANGACL